MVNAALKVRAARFAALGDPARLAIVDELTAADRTAQELQGITALSSNLLAYHLDVLEGAGLIVRRPSSGDGRRRYVCLEPGALANLQPAPPRRATQPALFVCTQNTARSQLAAALWRSVAGAPAASAGTHPAARVHNGTVAAARRAGLELGDTRPRSLHDIGTLPPLVVTVCDRAHEELRPGAEWLHWSIPDPVPVATAAAFDRTVGRLRERISDLVGASA